jgi:hypothetical protein
MHARAFADYQAIPAVNWSSLKYLRISPRHYKHALASPKKDTSALFTGRAGHVSILEPDEFPRRYVVLPDGWGAELGRNTKEGKRLWQEFCERNPRAATDPALKDPDEYKRRVFAEENPGKEAIDDATYSLCLAMRDAVRSHPAAARLLEEGQPEQSRFWTDAETGIECKARIDWDREGVLPDLKTARTINLHQFTATAWRLGYFHQFAMYRRAQAAHYGCKPDEIAPRIIAVESVAPHDVAVWTPDADSLSVADDEVTRLLRLLAECRATDKWPGQYPEETEIRAPRWAFNEEDEFNWIATEEAA